MYDSDVQWCLNLCNFLGVNPLKKKDLTQSLIFLFWFLSMCGSIFFTIVMICANEDTLTIKNLTYMATSLLMFPHGLSNLLNLFFNKNAIGELLNDTKETFWSTIDAGNSIKKSQKMRTFLRKSYFFFVILCCTSTIIRPFVLGEGAAAYQKYKPDFIPKYFFLILADTACASAVLSISCMDIIVLVLLMMAEVQFQILNNKLQVLFDFQASHKSHQKELHKRIKECVDQQNFLINFLDRFSSTFSGITLFFLGDIILTMCIIMYIISTDNTHINYRIEASFHLLAGLYEIVSCYSIPAQALMDQADKVSNSAYLSNWYEYPENAKTVLQIMIRDQKRIEITAGGFVMIDLQMFMAAVKTIVSYCMFLRTMEVAN